MVVGLIIQANLTATMIWLTNARKSRQVLVRRKISEIRSIMQFLNLKGNIFHEVCEYLERTEAKR